MNRIRSLIHVHLIHKQILFMYFVLLIYFTHTTLSILSHSYFPMFMSCVLSCFFFGFLLKTYLINAFKMSFETHNGVWISHPSQNIQYWVDNMNYELANGIIYSKETLIKNQANKFYNSTFPKFWLSECQKVPSIYAAALANQF